ncbi:hypothetical protein GUA87_00510 [Sneathiella sp. P13V-1]|uniref:hypothetical protein n=1 Tax=Sneathiella sp. P13V-1 TaxID=2697366 RepID=UPI00187B5D09|nr:hypothetical protein [Sneathiella sp. P13V-1]MBE7635309.1 hypothetical protein [Sneathiella sp. P13V-1]
MRFTACLGLICFLVFTAGIASSETETVSGKFLSNDQVSEFQVQHIREESVTATHSSGWKAQFELWGSVQAIGTCRDPLTERHDLLIFHCDFGNGPVCVEQIITSREGSPFLTVGRDTLFEGDYTPNEGQECTWRSGLKALDFIEKMVANWAPLSGQKEDATFDLNDQKIAKTQPKEISLIEFNMLLKKVDRYGPDLIQRDVVSENQEWKIHLITGMQTCKASGLVFAENKESNRVLSIYRVESGCSKALNFPPQEGDLLGDTLEADFCISCDWYGEWARFRWDLKSHEVQLIQNRE